MRPVTLFTIQWGDLPLEEMCRQAQEMGYVPNLIARSLVNGKSKMIGIVISDIKNLYFSEIVDAITRQARARGYMVCT